jgi:hypothetical protein
MSKANNKYGVKPEVIEKIKWTERDNRMKEWSAVDGSKNMIQGIVSTPPEQWSELQLSKAKKLQLNKMSVEQLRHWFDFECDDE